MESVSIAAVSAATSSGATFAASAGSAAIARSAAVMADSAAPLAPAQAAATSRARAANRLMQLSSATRDPDGNLALHSSGRIRYHPSRFQRRPVRTTPFLALPLLLGAVARSEEHTSELQSRFGI